MARVVKASAVVLLLALLIVAGWWWSGRSHRPGASLAGPPRPTAAAATPVRGGELIGSIRAEPGAYNRYVEATGQTDLLDLLTNARLVRVNRATDQLEPALAESWTQAANGQTFTLKLRPQVVFSDGVPFTSADVVFSFRALYDPGVNSPIRSGMLVAGKPLQVSAPDPATVVITLPAPFAPGLRLLDNLPILPRHKLEAALDTGRFREAWGPSRPLSDIAGLGPFVLTEHVSGQRLVFTRNAHYWRTATDGTQLPYLDKLTLLVIPDQTTEALRLQAGETDLMANGDIRPDDFAAFKRLADQGRVRMIDAGVGLDPNLLWFNLTPASKHLAWFSNKAFRQGISYAADRDAMANAVYLGTAVPIFGPVSPGNRTWYSTAVPTYPHDVAKARGLLASAGMTDRNGDGMLDDAAGNPVRFSIMTQKGHTIRERTAAVLQEQLRAVGIAVDVVTLDPGALFQRWQKRDYDTIYFAGQASATDPAMNTDFWLSSGTYHYWNSEQPSPATDWERRIDQLTHEQTAAASLEQRQRLFAEMQRIVGDELPAIFFVAPRVTIVVSNRVVNPTPAPQIPQLLWSADTLGAAARRGER